MQKATVNFLSANSRQTNMAFSDTDDDIIITTSALLIANSLSDMSGEFRKCRRNL